MTWFRDFSVPLWEIFGGNLLLLVTLAFYAAWWTILFYPQSAGNSAGAGLCIVVAMLTGMAAIALLITGVNTLSQASKDFLAGYILLGAVVFYVVSLVITKVVFQRIVTSELLLITVWAALELSVIVVLLGSQRFHFGQVLTLVILVALATIVGMVCYVLHYRLDESSRFWNGLIPLMVNAGMVLALQILLALS
jgi:hypothetical protein